MRKKIETIILEGAEAQGIALYEGKAEILANYLLELLKINEKINLTAVRDPEEAAVKHIVDSLVVEKAFGIEDRRILDLGTGGGFPGVPLAVACGGREVALLDSKKKKLNVIETIAGKLDINNLTFLPQRAEEASKEERLRESSDVCVARAVAELRVLLEIAVPLVKLKGKIIAMKDAESVAEEMRLSKTAIQTMGVELTEQHEYTLDGIHKRALLVFVKKKETSTKYPRRMPAILKRPL